MVNTPYPGQAMDRRDLKEPLAYNETPGCCCQIKELTIEYTASDLAAHVLTQLIDIRYVTADCRH